MAYVVEQKELVFFVISCGVFFFLFFLFFPLGSTVCNFLLFSPEFTAVVFKVF